MAATSGAGGAGGAERRRAPRAFGPTPLAVVQVLLLVCTCVMAQPPPSASPTLRPTQTTEYATPAPTGAATITHNPDWTEAQLISVIIGSVVGLTAVVLAVYCAYARGAFDEGPKITKGGPVEVVDGSREEISPIFRATDKP